jgi:hypothetical protein
MYSKPVVLKLIRLAVFMAVMYVSLQIAISFGIQSKSGFQMFWELVVGGSFGALSGLAFFLIFGAIGWVCGALYGSIGLLWLMVGGALGGLGMGALANIIRNPQKYNFNWPILIFGLLAGFFLAKVLSEWAVRRASGPIPPSEA